MEPIDLASFLGLVAQGFNVVPLSATLQLDRETPVSLYSDSVPERSSCWRAPPWAKPRVATPSSDLIVAGG